MAYKMTGRLTIRCDEKLIERLNNYADLHGKNSAELARNCIENWLSKKESSDRNMDALDKHLESKQADKRLERLKDAAAKRVKFA
jgi:predicted DNA-binding protein